METINRKEFKIDKSGIQSIKNNYSIWSFLIYLVIDILVSFGIRNRWSLNGVPQSASYSNWFTFFFFFPFIFLGIFLLRRRLNGIYGSFVLRVDDISLEKVTNDFKKNQKMNIADILEIRKTHDGNMFIYSHKDSKPINIPRQLENRDELEIILKNIGRPFADSQQKFYQRYGKQLFFIFFLLTAIDFLIANKCFVIIDSISLLGLSIAFFLKIFKNYKLSKKQHALPLSLMIFIFATITIILARMLYVILR